MVEQSDEGEVTIRAATDGDLDEVARIERETFREPMGEDWFEGYLEDPGFAVAVRENAVAGFALVDTVDGHDPALGHLKDVAVRESDRGRGIGSSLLDAVVDELRGRGARSVALEVRRSNERGISFYRRHGFETRREVPRYYGDGEDALVMLGRVDRATPP